MYTAVMVAPNENATASLNSSALLKQPIELLDSCMSTVTLVPFPTPFCSDDENA